ncbi:hypothetical protein BCV69DRAFT_282984 [Microstroma glucosiphilum]|uniref:PHD-type domain-containing protein n=1 Tax=Pseudomicrostroma glucosiphilum TaxID=1684307 RepID=A0A316U6B6_9BASI|nr:hypothetical protein BCV69DRAFT_282984 [Pseudomicrostroma glucosiphilum]PWN20762.1 hypothetical protein BCV69DRAFT_282984 [Pseudomicrostroma glucosiphilum]
MPAAEEAESSSAAASPSREDAQLKRKRSSSASPQEQGRSPGHVEVTAYSQGTDDPGANGNQDPPAPRGSPPPMPNFQYVPRVPARLKPGEELLDEAAQAKLLAKRTRDSERKWLASQRAKFAAAHGFEFSPRTYKPPTSSSGANNSVEDVQVEEDETPVAPPASAPSKPKMGKKAAAVEKVTSELVVPQPEAVASLPSPAEEPEDRGQEDSDDDGSSEGGKLYCICRTLYDDDKMMIACDHCDQWYHVLCMKMKNEQADLIDVFVCPRCEPTTTERTTWKPPCARQACTKAARPPLTKYCSDRCGMLVAAARIAKTKQVKAPGGLDRLYSLQVQTARKKEGLVVWGGEEGPQDGLHQTWFQRLDTLHIKDSELGLTLHEISPAGGLTESGTKEEEDLLDLRRALASLTSHKQASSASLDLVMGRIQLLELAYDRAGDLPPVQVSDESASSNKKKTKGSKGSAGAGDDTIKTQPRCGYDERLSWDDERFVAWMKSEQGEQILKGSAELDGRLHDADEMPMERQTQPGEEDAMDVDQRESPSLDPQQSSLAAVPTICGLVKRKCRKHADWSVVRGNDFDAEKKLQTTTLSDLSEQEAHMRARIADLAASIEAKKLYQDERMALSLARETSRLAAMGGANGRSMNGH